MIDRRRWLGAAGAALSGAGLAGLASSSAIGETAAGDYRALIVLVLYGGCDGHNVIVPTDAAYNDYQAARANLALPKAALVTLPGRAAGHSFGLHPAMAPLAPLYGRGRLAFIANAGPLAVPCTAAQVIANEVRLPPFLMAHPEQIAVQLGWLASADNDTSGWAGRSLELLPSALRHPLAGLTLSRERTLVLGRHTSPSDFGPGTRAWGPADLLQPASATTQDLLQMGRWQFSNDYLADYARQMGQALEDSTTLAQVLQAAQPPHANFEANPLATDLRLVASALPVFKAMGFRRQVFQLTWGLFDHHAEQRGSGPWTQDTQLATLAKAMAAFDEANLAAGLDLNVTMLVVSDFGRSLRPASGGGSEHAWGNHWFALGGAVAGGTVHGTFPTLTLGGPDDADGARGGRFVPSSSSDQVAASVMQWMGLPAERLLDVFPNLAGFPQKSIALMRG